MENFIMKLIVILIFIIVVYYFVKKERKYTLVLNEYFWLIIPWLVCLLLYFFSGIKYSFNLNLMSYIYIFATLTCFIFGYKISIKKNISNKITNMEMKTYNKKKNFKLLVLIDFICVLIYAIYILLNNDITLGVTRNIETNFFTTFLLLISCSSLVIWLYEFSYSIIKMKRITIYGILSAIIYNIPGIIISGRDALMIFLISTFIVFIYSMGCLKQTQKEKSFKILKRLKKYSIITLIIMLVYLCILSTNRYGTNDRSAINMFEWSAKCEFPDYLLFMNDKMGGIGKLTNNAIFYYSSQISKYSLIFEEYKGPYLYGFYQMHYISRLLPEQFNLDYGLVSNAQEEISMSVGAPGIKVLWETGIGYSIYDFGRIGTLIISFIGGILIGILSIYCKNNMNIEKLILNTFICVGLFWTVQMSPLFDYFYIFPLFWIVLIEINNKSTSDNDGEKTKEPNVRYS